MGLGLYIVEGIVRAHGGTAEEGTTFTARLPRTARDARAEEGSARGDG